MTVDFPTSQKDKDVPILDLKVRIDSNKNNDIFLKHYEKQPTVLHYFKRFIDARTKEVRLIVCLDGFTIQIHEIEWETKVKFRL